VWHIIPANVLGEPGEQPRNTEEETSEKASGIVVNEFAQWLSETRLSLAIQTHLWVIPTIQSIHIVCIGMVLAAVFMIDLRIFGWAGRDQTLLQTTRRLRRPARWEYFSLQRWLSFAGWSRRHSKSFRSAAPHENPHGFLSGAGCRSPAVGAVIEGVNE